LPPIVCDEPVSFGPTPQGSSGSPV
jgi:hypothetical protein